MPSPGASATPPLLHPSSAPVTWDAWPSPGELADLDRESFTPAWGIASYREWSTQPHIACWVLRAGMPAQTVGWAVCQVVAPEAEILRFGVRPPLRRTGWGRMLLEGVRERLQARAVTRIGLEVRAGNVAAQALYRRAGFRQTGRRRGYYPDTQEDAVVMAWEDPGSAGGS